MLFRFFKMKYFFRKPKKCKILVYDKQSISFARILFEKRNLSVFDKRYESINLYVLFLTLINFRFKNFKDLYKRIYFNFVSPDIIYTSIYNDLSFFKLKAIYPDAEYIADQNGLRDPDFIKSLKKSSINKNLKIDHFFVFSKHDENILSKYIKCKYYVAGKTDNNSIRRQIKPHSKNSKKKILFISGKMPDRSKINYIESQKLIFCRLIEICKIKKIKLFFKEKKSFFKHNTKLEYSSTDKRKSFYQNHFGSKSWYFIPYSYNHKKKYNLLHKFNFVILQDSTLGYELLSKGVKILCLTNKFPVLGLDINFNKKREGLFWTNKTDLLSITKKINNIINMPSDNWRKVASNFSKKILSFDNNNLKKKDILYKILIR